VIEGLSFRRGTACCARRTCLATYSPSAVCPILGRHSERSFARFCFSRGLCGRETQRGISLRSPMHLARTSRANSASLFFLRRGTVRRGGCPAHMLGYLLTIRLALTGAVILSEVSRGPAFPAVCAGAKRSRRTSLRSPSHLVASTQRGAVFSLVGACHTRRTCLGTSPPSASCQRVPGTMWSAGACSRCLPLGLARACSSHQPTNVNLPIGAFGFM
jgi:hypothetical protein